MGHERGVDGFAEVAAAARVVQQEIERVRGSARSPDGAVTVEAGADGRIVALDLSPDALRLGSEGLARLIVQLHAAAVADADAAAEPLRAAMLADPVVARAVARVEAARDLAPTDAEDDPDRYYTGFSVFGVDPTRRG